MDKPASSGPLRGQRLLKCLLKRRFTNIFGTPQPAPTFRAIVDIVCRLGLNIT